MGLVCGAMCSHSGFWFLKLFWCQRSLFFLNCWTRPCATQYYFKKIGHGSDSKESACDAGDLGTISGLGRCPGEGNGNALQYSGLENSMDRGAWWHDSKTNTGVSHVTALEQCGYWLLVFLLVSVASVVPLRSGEELRFSETECW